MNTSLPRNIMSDLYFTTKRDNLRFAKIQFKGILSGITGNGLDIVTNPGKAQFELLSIRYENNYRTVLSEHPTLQSFLSSMK